MKYDTHPTITLMALPQPVLVSSMVMENLDAMDNSDAFISSATFRDGTPLDDNQLDTLTDSGAGSQHLFSAACRNFNA
jgi:hypothetical protein